MNRSRAGIVIAAAIMLAALAMPVAAGSGPKLHPSGFGEHSYASWKGGEGLPDTTTNRDQALYFQKMTSTTTVAAGVAVFNGVQGLPVSAVWPLAFDYRTDGWCGAGAPRFNLRVDSGGVETTYFYGCNSGMVATGTTFDDDGTWIRKEAIGPAPAGTVVSLAIVFDEGNDVGQGYVYLDNIQAGSWVWTSASDNGGGNTTVDAVTLESMWGAPLATLLR